MTNLATLSEKNVINLCDGKDLGYVCDLQLDTDDGRICAIIVPKDQCVFSFGKCDNIIIPWDKVECIGEDAILVRISLSDCACDDHGGRGKGKRRFFKW
ncbi:MAG: YlmC/YmxH family sporulation protein [Ruminococcaceae bacterium]|nr:YlmC/YmxH family sporulation protein [Oscillospiraceae bacterium]